MRDPQEVLRGNVIRSLALAADVLAETEGLVGDDVDALRAIANDYVLDAINCLVSAVDTVHRHIANTL